MVIVAALTFTLHQSNRPAEAQGSATIAATNFTINSTPDCTYGFVTLTNGDVYHVSLGAAACISRPDQTIYTGNIWSGGPIPAENSTWGAIKARGGKLGGVFVSTRPGWT